MTEEPSDKEYLTQEWLNDLMWENTPEWRKKQLIEERESSAKRESHERTK